ncbi:helix-turn-helix domain-containing protein [Mycolicibacterium stellerae]|uniref:helix-turn-helix domain-containing protein n=1 Tax=Mycolicibacterium stellerae TaxID=2358193 RepID=UPI000F0B05B1|nr:helix-turn-helix domain-containing protein [Mycolicibacterium stellerae]
MGPQANPTATAVDSDMLSAVIDMAPTPLWVIGSNGNVALANQAALGMLGYRSAGDVIGAPSHDTLHEWRPDGSRYPSDSCPILDGRGSHATSAPEWFITRAGRPIPVTWSTRPIGTGGARLLSFADATERLAAKGTHDDERDVLAAVEAAAAPSRAALRASLLAHVRTRFRDPGFTAATLAAELHVSLRSVQQLLAEEGRSPATEIRRRRLEFASSLIARGTSVHHACRASGFSETGTFTRAFRRHFGKSPSEWARTSA